MKAKLDEHGVELVGAITAKEIEDTTNEDLLRAVMRAVMRNPRIIVPNIYFRRHLHCDESTRQVTQKQFDAIRKFFVRGGGYEAVNEWMEEMVDIVLDDDE